MLRAWALTVYGDRYSRVAISRFVSPAAIRWRTSISRLLRSSMASHRASEGWEPSAKPDGSHPSEARCEAMELLSKREIEVLHLIAAGLTNREIATRLYLSPYTVKAHARSIYDKLDAHSRTQAAARARELGILPLL